MFIPRLETFLRNLENKMNYKKDNGKLFLRPCVVVLSGIPLSGKTVLAEKLVERSNFKMIDVDIIRNEIDESRKENH